MIGASKYDAECAAALESAKAKLVLLMVIEGDRGNGISCRGYASLMQGIPAMLREYADKLEREGGILMADSPAGTSGGKVPPRRM